MTNKSKELYSACLKVVFEIIPDFEPNFAVSNLEGSPRNAFKNKFLGFRLQDAYSIAHKLFGIV